MDPLFAQFNNPNNNFPGNPNFNPAAAAGMIAGILLCWLVVYYAVVVVVCLVHSKALSRVSPENRLMEPGRVWLALIPLFAGVWFPIMALETIWSLRREFEARGWHRRGDDYGRKMWITWQTIPLAGYLFIFIPLIGPFILLACGLAALVCFIIYLVQISGFGRQLADGGYDEDDYGDRPRSRSRRAADVDDEYEDDRPRNRRRDDDDYDDDEEDRPRRRR